MSIRVYDKADREYIKKLLDELEDDRNYCFDIEIDETRVNGTITNLHIQAKQVDQCSF